MNWLRFWWRYARGHTPWDTGIVPPEVIALAGSLPPGRALDLGCGTGTSAIYLASRGWRVVGVDFVGPAIQMARRKARLARAQFPSMQLDFCRADVTRLDFLDGPFDLVLDVGCFHGLDEAGRGRYAAHLARLTRPGATFVVYAFAPRERAGQRIGVTEGQLRQQFAPAFTLVSATHGQDKGDGPPSAWYYLQRN